MSEQQALPFGQMQPIAPEQIRMLSEPANDEYAPPGRTGRPQIEYKPHYAEQAYQFALMGVSRDGMAKAFGIGRNTVMRWEQRHPDFAAAVARGGVRADAAVASSLYKRAVGYTIRTDRGETHYPPDVSAAKLWLALRQPEIWGSASEFAEAGAVQIEVKFPEPEQPAALEGKAEHIDDAELAE